MWIFLDDFADDLSAGLHKKGRIIACAAIGVVTAGICAFNIVNIKGQSAAVAQADAKIAELQNSITEGKVKQVDLKNSQTSYYNVSDTCGKIAELQSKYGGYSSNTAMMDIEADIKKTREELAPYISDGTSGSPWFNMPTQKYTWNALNSADSTVRNVPVIWECTGSDGNIYAICTGTYDGDMERAGNFNTKVTRYGSIALGRPDPSEQERIEDPSGVEEIQENVDGETTENEDGSESGTGTVEGNKSISAGSEGYNQGFVDGANSYREASSTPSSGTSTTVSDSRYKDLPPGYTDKDRATTADSSLDPEDGKTPAVTQDELDYAKLLTKQAGKDWCNKFYALNHAARAKFMSEHPVSQGTITGLDSTTTNSGTGTGSSSGSYSSGSSQNTTDGTGTSNMSNDDVLRQIMQ